MINKCARAFIWLACVGKPKIVVDNLMYEGEVGIMPRLACVVVCKKCGFEIRSDWKFCPNCEDKIVCTGKHQTSAKEVHVC